MVCGDDPFYLKFRVKWPSLERNRDFEPIIARSASAVRPSEKRSINTNRKSTTRFPRSPRKTSYVVPKSPKGGGAQKCTLSKIWTISCDNSETARDRMSVTVIIIGSRIQAFDWYIPRWPWMTLNGVIALILIFFTEFDCFVGQLRHSGWRHSYNVRKILSPICSLPLLATTNPPCSAVSLRQLSYLLVFILQTLMYVFL